MLKETLSSLNTASGHGLLKGPCSHREASVTSHVAVCTGRSSLSPSGVQSIKTRFAFHRRDVRESPDCAIGRTNFSCLSLHSPRTTRYAQIKFNLQVLSFLIQNFPLAKALERNYGRSSWETAGSPWRDSYDMDRKWPGVSPGKEKIDITLCLWNLLELTLQKKKKIEQFQGCNWDYGYSPRVNALHVHEKKHRNTDVHTRISVATPTHKPTC